MPIIMRMWAVLFVLLACASPAASPALEPLNEARAMLYYQFAFGASPAYKQAHKYARSGNSRHGFGLRLDRAGQAPGGLVRPAIFDLRFSGRGAESLTIAGVDYLHLYRLHRADEEDAAVEDDLPAGQPPSDEAEAGQRPNPAVKFAKDLAETMGGLLDAAPAGVLLGLGIGVALIADVDG